MSRRRRENKRRRRVMWRRLLLAVVSIVFLFYGSIRLIGFCMNSVRNRRTNREIESVYNRDSMPISSQSTELDSVNNGRDVSPQNSTENIEASFQETIHTEVETLEAATLLRSYHNTTNPIQQKLKTLYEKNNDLVGWLEIPGVVNLPVVYRDNEYYLNHDFYGKKSSAGTLFLDVSHPLLSDSQHLVIHGHDQVDGSMFGLLIHYRKLNYVFDHGIISFSTLFQDEKYVIYAVLMVSEKIGDRDYFPYTGTRFFSSIGEFEAFIHDVEARSLFEIPIDVVPSDALLTLSTCLENKRVLVMYRRIRDNESDEALLSLLSLSSTK